MISIVFMALMLAALGTYFYLLENNYIFRDGLPWLPVTLLFICLIAYSFGYGQLPWLIISEVYSEDYYAIASALSGLFNWILAFAIPYSFGIESVSMSIDASAAIWIFASLSFIGIFFTCIIVIETKAKSLVDIQRILAGEN